MEKIKDKIKLIIDTKAFHICVIILIITVLILIAVRVIMQYEEKGETNIPFNIAKINIISSSIGENVEGESQTTWNINISQNNDIYVYIEKNQSYPKEEVIKSVVLDNFDIQRKSNQGVSRIYKPDSMSEKELFKNTEENSVESLEFIGETQSNIKNMKMSNQGDMIYFRYCNKDVAKYESNDEEINHNELLKKAGISEDLLQTKVTFDLTMNLVSNKKFKTTITLDLPIKGITEKGTVSEEKTDLSNLVFKRENIK